MWRARLAPLLAALAVGCAALPLAAGGVAPAAPPPLLSAEPLPEQRCAPAPPLAGLSLTEEERELLQHVCWPAGPEGEPLPHEAAAAALGAEPRGVPAGLNCTVVQWCDSSGACSDVCARGSVWVEPWLAHAIAQQARLTQTLPLCYASLLGTHNSAITLADGYGNLDAYFQGFFKYIKWALHDFSDAPLHTNNQLLSLTDQLNLGVRALEVDTHWVGGILRIAHCGGLHIPQLNRLVQAINLVAKLLHKDIKWDTESLGCQPSLSSIPALEQRLFTDALQEVRAWMDAPGNGKEFVVLYFDDQANLATWGVVPRMLEDILSVFPRQWIFTTQDKAAAGDWPSQQQMLLAGKRLLLVSGYDYGAAMQPLVFGRGDMLCGWNEPSLAAVAGVPDCQVGNDAVERRPLFDGLLTRVISCELQYGPLNCDFVWRGSNQPVWDEFTLPPVVGCGLNMPSPDLLTPSRAAAAIWTWAPGHPYTPSLADAPALRRLVAAGSGASSGAGASGSDSDSDDDGGSDSDSDDDGGSDSDASDSGSRSSSSFGTAVQAPPANCGVISAGDARWRAVPCTLPALPSACRVLGAALGATDGWAVNASLPRGSCPPGSQYDLPRHPRENYLLAAALAAGGHEAAWLPVHGPDWSTDGWPAERQQRQPTSRRGLLLHAALPAAGVLAAAVLAVAGAVAGRRVLLCRRQAHRDGLYQALEAEPAPAA